MHRLFVALRPPPAVRAALIALMRGVPGARWQDDEQLHITLRFIGEVERSVAEDAAAALATVAAAPLALSLAGTGLFDRRGRPHSLWTGIAPHQGITALHRKVDRAIAGIGLLPETRAYLPHVTLARMNSGVDRAALERWLADHAALASAPFTATHMLLFESRLGAEGARYEAVARWELTGG